MSRLKAIAGRWQREGRITREQRRRLQIILAEVPRTASGKTDPEFDLLMHLVDVAYGYLEENGLTEAGQPGAESNVSTVADVARLLQAQLSETNSVTETAALAIMGKLTEVHTEAGRLIATLGGTRNRATALQGDAGVKIEQSKRLLEGMTAYQEELSGRVAETIQEVIHQIAELKSLTTLINGITKTTTILSLNATIEAARSGTAGKAFAVIAEEMRQLSKRFEVAAKSIEVKFTEFSATVNIKLKSVTELVQRDDETQWFASLGLALPRLSGDFQSVVGELEAFAGNTETVVQAIRAAIVAALEHSQFQDISRQQLEQVSKGIRLMAQGSDGLEGVSTPGDIVGALAAGYHMDSQRIVHTQALGNNPTNGAPESGELPKIELF